MSSKYLTISELEQGDMSQPIWALNGSADSAVGMMGDVVVGIPKLNGSKVDPMLLPQTWLPTCLTDQIPRAQLLASSEFRTAVNKRLIVLIEADYAKVMLEQEGAKEERERLDETARAVREATAARTVQSGGAEIISTSELDDRAKDAAHTATIDPNEMDPGFVMFAENLSLKNDLEAKNLIRGRGRFKSSELRYLLKHLNDKPKTSSFVKQLLK